MTGWFGERWGAPVCAYTPQHPTPVGTSCGWCGEEIVDGDQGILMPLGMGEAASMLAFHVDCNVRSVIGGANCQLGRCESMHGGGEPCDPAGLTRRQAATLAVEVFQRQQAARPEVN